MKHYAGQKAQQAMEELLKEASLEERLMAAGIHLLLIAGNKDFIEDSTAVEEAAKAFTEAFHGDDLHAKAQATGYFIEAIFEECGATDTMERLKD